MKLTEKQKAFCDEYIIDFNASRAAISAGYSEKTARAIAAENLTKPYIQEYLAKLKAERAERVQIDQDYVLRVIKNTVERCSQAEQVKDREGNPTGEYKFDSTAVLKGAELLGKHLAMFTDRSEVKSSVKLENFSIKDMIKFDDED